MNTIDNSKQDQTKKPRLPWWIGFALAIIVWEGGPWAVSLLTRRYGWINGRPSAWNLLGLIPVIVGTIGLLWTLGLHFAESPQGVEWVLDKSYFLRRGPYTFSRNPMYLSELTLLLGWVIFYGSVVLLIAFVLTCVLFNSFALPQEEHVLEERFGEAYREYKKKVPRWFGRVER